MENRKSMKTHYRLFCKHHQQYQSLRDYDSNILWIPTERYLCAESVLLKEELPSLSFLHNSTLSICQDTTTSIQNVHRKRKVVDNVSDTTMSPVFGLMTPCLICVLSGSFFSNFFQSLGTGRIYSLCKLPHS